MPFFINWPKLEFSKPKKMTCANCWLWFALCVIYYGISLSSTSLAGNPFLNNGEKKKDFAAYLGDI